MSIDLFRTLIHQVNTLATRVDDLVNQGQRVSIAARYASSAGQSIPNNAMTVIDFGTKGIDTHDAVVVGADWRFVAPARGNYLVSTSILFTNTTAWALGEFAVLSIYRNGSLFAYVDRKDNYPNSNLYMQLSGAILVDAVAGDAISVRIQQNSGGALTLFNVAAYVHCSIARV